MSSSDGIAVLGGVAGGFGVLLIGAGTGSTLAALGALLLALYGAAVLWALPRHEREAVRDWLDGDDRSRIQRLQDEAGEWSDATFGYNRSAEGPIAHLAKEIEELADNPGDRLEYADCLLLLLDAYRLAGGSADDLVGAAWQKFGINRSRVWGEPDENGVVEHVRNAETAKSAKR
jgi:hypothetical protein